MSDPNRRIVDGVNTAHELALGAALGAIIGIIPKDSAFAWLLILVLLISRGNLLCGIISAVAFSFLSPLFDVWFDQTGYQVLTHASLSEVWASWIEIPWVAWTRFNNTVVMGSAVIGLGLSIPFYLVCRLFFKFWGLSIIHASLNLPFVRIFLGDSESDPPAADPEAALSQMGDAVS